MTENSIEKQLQSFFRIPTRADWEKIAMQETDGKDPFETLSWRGKDNIKFSPYYDAHDTARLSLVPAGIAHQTHKWLSLPAVTVSENTYVNNLAQEFLNRGADGIFFYRPQHRAPSVDVLAGEVDLSTCSLFFRLHDDQHFGNVFSSQAADGVINKYTGALFWESIPKTSKLADAFRRWKEFRVLGIVIDPASPSEEIARALLDGVQTFECFRQTAIPTDVFHSICFSVTADVSFLECVAKIRALRSLWLQIAHAYGYHDYHAADLHIHARSLATSDGAYAPHENMLKATFASMAATAAGCDSLTIEGAHESLLFDRWSANVSNILREESFFDRVADPFAGAYAVEVMTDAIARKAWEIFQSKVKTL